MMNSFRNDPKKKKANLYLKVLIMDYHLTGEKKKKKIKLGLPILIN